MRENVITSRDIEDTFKHLYIDEQTKLLITEMKRRSSAKGPHGHMNKDTYEEKGSFQEGNSLRQTEINPSSLHDNMLLDQKQYMNNLRNKSVAV